MALDTATTTPTTNTRSSARVLQRKCACGGKTGASGECDECRKQKRKGSIQRSATTLGDVQEDPSTVNEVLNSPGRPLDANVGGFMESRFGQDFSDVRIHSDANVAKSAAAINAHAYAVGSHIAFADGNYRPDTLSGKRLLAHELTHVIQQSGYGSSSASLRIDTNVAAESEADATADSVIRGGAVPEMVAAPKAIARQKNQPTTQPAKPVAKSFAGQTMSDSERTRVESVAKGPAPELSPRFVLHDTASPLEPKNLAKASRNKIDKELTEARGQGGFGIFGWVPEKEPATQTRPAFEQKRPTPTNLEKTGGDQIKDVGDREQMYRDVWRLTKPAIRMAALNKAVTGTGLTTKEIAKEKKSALKQLAQGKRTKADAKKRKKTEVFTTGIWTIQNICDELFLQGSAKIAATPKDAASLQMLCVGLGLFFAGRDQLIASGAHVEMFKETGLKPDPSRKNKWDGNPCLPDSSNPRVQRLSPYTQNQYEQTAMLYVKSAAAIGRFPEITTHFWEDHASRGHCDPRCFDLGRLYKEIAKLLGHAAGSTYGPTPSYGTKYGTNNVWWTPKACGAKPTT